MQTVGTIFASILGLALGSFLNVCLSRWPDGESVVMPRSHCRTCNHALAWWENVPLLSWVTLRGRCKACGNAISWRYPLVELAVGVATAVCAWNLFGRLLTVDLNSSGVLTAVVLAAGQVLLFWILLALAVLDVEYLWLPDWLTLPGMALGIVFHLLPLILLGPSENVKNLAVQKFGVFGVVLRWLAGMLAAALLVLAIRWLYSLLRRREGVGLGDAKLMALLAAWLGFPAAVLSFGLAAILGSIAGVFLLVLPKLRREPGAWATSKLPLGTFLCAGGIISSLWGPQIIAAYLRWAGL